MNCRGRNPDRIGYEKSSGLGQTTAAVVMARWPPSKNSAAQRAFPPRYVSTTRTASRTSGIPSRRRSPQPRQTGSGTTLSPPQVMATPGKASERTCVSPVHPEHPASTTDTTTNVHVLSSAANRSTANVHSEGCDGRRSSSSASAPSRCTRARLRHSGHPQPPRGQTFSRILPGHAASGITRGGVRAAVNGCHRASRLAWRLRPWAR